MNAVDVFCWIVIGGAISLVLGFFVWSLCVIAGQSDKISDEIWNEYCRKAEKEAGDCDESKMVLDED